MIITIASGKGGTGKTSVSFALASSLSEYLNEEITVLDCDVEEPNMHVFIKADSVKEEKFNVFIPQVIAEKCSLCGKCEDLCQFSAIVKVNDSFMVFPAMCHSCKGCKIICPENAIADGKKELGTITDAKDKNKNIRLIYGTLKVGEPMSPPLIDAVKKGIKKENINIIDAPPGTSCPVISAVRGSDFVILVTEPTPFGLNDLKLAVETVRILKIPFGIIINRADLGDDEVKKYAQKENIGILMEIPNKREIAESYSRGENITTAMPELKEQFKELYLKIKRK